MTRTHIMIHHSLTGDGTTVSWGAIRNYHLAQGWHDIGYHAGVELIGDHYEALLGRPETEEAAACRQGNMNKLALHLCIVGNFDLAPPADTLLRFAARYVVRPWLVRYNLLPEHIVGHREFATYKSCPGDMFDLESLRRLVQ